MSFLDETGLVYLWKKIKIAAYPVGSIYVSTSGTSPATLFGGTWEQIHGRFLLGASSSHSAGSTGGEETHKLTTAEMPAHSHTFHGQAATTSGNSVGHTHSIPKLSGSTSTNGNHQHSIPAVQAGAQGGSLTILGGGGDAITGSAGNHSHSVTTNASTTGWQSANHTHTVTANGYNDNSGGNVAHTNMPPYLSVYMWKRTA